MEKVRFGVIGAGGIADRRTLPGMMVSEFARPAALMEVDMAQAQALAARYGAPRAYDSVDALLRDEDVEAVYIASPVFAHAEQVLAAARAGKHILVEKPVGLTCDQTRELTLACREAGVLLGGGMMMRCHSHHRRMREMIAAGQIGQVVSCRAQLTCWYPPIPGAWRQIKALGGGGALMDLAVHCVDLITWITGSPVARVSAIVDTKTHDYEVDDSAALLMQLQNGANAYVDVHFNLPDDAAHGRLEVYGTGGSLLCEDTIGQVEGGTLSVTLSDPNRGYDAAQQREGGDRAAQPVAEPGNLYARELDGFALAVRGLGPVPVPAQEMLRTERVCEAAYRSAAEGRFITLQEDDL